MRSRVSGVTLIELLVAMAVLAVLAVMAVPSFSDFRQRSIVRGSADQAVAFWANARMEALKRNSNVTVSLWRDAGTGEMCLGADADAGGCNCLSGACDIASYPAKQDEWKGAEWVGATDLGGNASESLGVATISPKSGALTNSTHAGGVTFGSGGSPEYQLRFYVDRWGRAYLCEPQNAPTKLSDYSDRRCSQ